MRRLSWVIQVSLIQSRASLKAENLSRRCSEGEWLQKKGQRDDTLWALKMEEGAVSQALGTGRRAGNRSSPRASRRNTAWALDFNLKISVLDFWPTKLGDTAFVLFYIVNFVTVCYKSFLTPNPRWINDEEHNYKRINTFCTIFINKIKAQTIWKSIYNTYGKPVG